ncbi:MAG: DUF5947 family protein [Bryobacteraceae bacterium]
MSAEKIETLVRQTESISDPEARGVAVDLLKAALEFHAAALERLLEIAGKETVDRIAADELVSSLLLLHDLHPDSLETRIRRAVGKLQDMFSSLGAKLSLTSIEGEEVRLHFDSGQTWSLAAVRESIENAIFQAAPEIGSVTIEGVKEPVPANFVPLSQLAEVRQDRSLAVAAPSAPSHIQFTEPQPQGSGVPGLSEPRPSGRGHREHEHCELCSAPVGEPHQHLVEPRERRLICTCDACAILFASGGETQYRRVPRDIRCWNDFRLSDQAWNSLAIPIGLAFLFRSSASNQMLAVYPSPAGPTEAALDEECWEEIVRDNPELRKMTADIEALLINRMNGAREYFWAPIDECYRLTGLVRKYWRGFSGGEEGWKRIREFFDSLKERSYAGSFV